MAIIKRISVIILTVFSATVGFSQTNLNDYKYVIVEKQFHFQNEPNENDFNNMVRFQFRKHGFTAILDGTPLPDDLKSNYCLALKSEITAKGALRTKGKITLTDCNGIIVFTSRESITKEKNFVRAFDLAIRGAFDSFNGLNYKYVPSDDIIAQGLDNEAIKQVQDAKKEIEALKAEIKELKVDIEPDQEAKAADSDQMDDIKANIPSEEEALTESVPEEVIAVYTARATKDGYELRTMMNRLIYTLYLTGKKDVYIFNNSERSGIVYKTDDGDWMLETLIEGNKQSEKIKIKF